MTDVIDLMEIEHIIDTSIDKVARNVSVWAIEAGMKIVIDGELFIAKETPPVALWSRVLIALYLLIKITV